MKIICILAIIGVCILLDVVNGQTQLPQYSTRYNNLNVDQILSSDRLVTNYVECLLSRKPCPPEGKDLKRILPEALRTKCARCSPQQREGGLKVITKLYYDYPTQYNRLKAKWDPTGEYHRRFEEYLRGLQFNTINNDPAQAQSFGNALNNNNNNNNQPKGQALLPAASSNNQNVVPTAAPNSQNILNNTQRPARNPEIAPNTNIRTTNSVSPPAGVSNRFGANDDDDDNLSGSSVDQSVVIPSTTTARVLPTLAAVPAQRATQQTTKRPPKRVTEAPLMVRPKTGQTAVVKTKKRPTEVEYTVYTVQAQPAVIYVTHPNPLFGLINSIGFKITNTADFFAGMLRGTIQKWFIV